VGGFKFVLHTLTIEENDEVLSAMTVAKDDFKKISCMRIAALARAVDTVNGVPLEDVPGVNKQLDVIPRREALLISFQLPMVVKLFEIYNKMLERSDAVFKVAGEEQTLKN